MLTPHKQLFILGSKKRNPALFDWYRFLKESEFWTREQLAQYQTDQCRNLLIFARDHSPFWRKRFKDHGFVPEHFSSLEDLRVLEPVTKDDVIDHQPDIQSRYPFKKTFFCETSGSTGKPLFFHRNESWDSFNRAAMMRGYSWFHVDPWEKNGYLKGSAFNPGDKILHRSLDMLQNRFRLFSYEEKHMVRFLKKLQKASYLEGYSSMIYELAKMARKHGMEKTFHLKLIKGTSEQIFNSYQILAKEVFNSKIISEYGAVEAGIIGFECPQGNMHINMEQVIAEEENHEIVVTNLHSFSFPIIRYKLGDYVELSEGYCDCGMKHPLIKNVRGRVGKIIYGKDETYPSITIPFIFENLQLHHNLSLHYQLIQHHKGHLTIKIEQNLDQHTSNLIEKEMVRHFGRDMDFEFETNVPILTDRGKMKTFISTIE